MKKLLILLFLLLAPLVLHGSEGEKAWFCRQNGTVGNSQAMIVSSIFSDSYSNHYEQRRVAFEKFTKKRTKGKFIPSFEAKCRDYTSVKHANKHRSVEIKTAKKYRAKIIEFYWEWRPNDRSKR